MDQHRRVWRSRLEVKAMLTLDGHCLGRARTGQGRASQRRCHCEPTERCTATVQGASVGMSHKPEAQSVQSVEFAGLCRRLASSGGRATCPMPRWALPVTKSGLDRSTRPLSSHHLRPTSTLNERVELWHACTIRAPTRAGTAQLRCPRHSRRCPAVWRRRRRIGNKEEKEAEWLTCGV